MSSPRPTGARVPSASPAWPALLPALAVAAASVPGAAWICDDAYISWRYGRNLAQGLGFAYSEGHGPVEGFSNLLWVLLAAGVYALGGDVPRTMLLLSGLTALGALALVFAVGRALGAGAVGAGFAAWWLAWCPAFAVWATGGLETMPFTLALNLCACAALLGWTRTAALSGVATALLRVEGAAWVAVITGIVGLARGLRGLDTRPAWVTGLVGLGAAVALALFRWTIFGDTIPHVSRMKGELHPAYLEAGAIYVAHAVLYGAWVAVPAWIVAARDRDHRHEVSALALLLVGMWVWCVLVGGCYLPWGRLLVPGLPLAAVVIGVAVDRIWRADRRWGLAIGLAITAIQVAPALEIDPRPALVRGWIGGPRRGDLRDARAWELQVGITRTLRRKGLALAELGRRIGVRSVVEDNIGAIGWFSGLEIHDRYGLVDREAAAAAPVRRRGWPGHRSLVPPTFFLDRRPDVLDFDLVSDLGSAEADGARARLAGWEADGYRTVELALERVPRTSLLALVREELAGPLLGEGPVRGVVLVVADDLGWGGTSVPMDPALPAGVGFSTPNLERLAVAGTRFSQAYAAAPTCQPSRAGLQTGTSPIRFRMTTTMEPEDRRSAATFPLLGPPEAEVLPTEVLTLAEHLAATRPEVASAHFGKWHLGAGGPESHGWSAGDGATNNLDGTTAAISPDPKHVRSLTRRALSFIGEQVAAERPFLVQISHYAVHSPLSARANTLRDAPGRSLLRASTSDLDASLGELLDGLEALGVADGTLVVVTSDNGAPPDHDHRPNGPLRGSKASLWEGGLRVPLTIVGPGVRPRAHADVPVTLLDLFATCADALGAPPAPTDGGSLLPVLRGQSDAVTRPGNPFVWHLPHYKPRLNGKPRSAARVGDLKVVHDLEEDTVLVFDLGRDPLEQVDLATERPDEALELRTTLRRELEAVGALWPTPNPEFTGAEVEPRRRGGSRP